MKRLLTFALVLMSLTTFSFAADQEDVGETATDCPMMAESNERNVKNIGSQDVKAQSKRPTATAQ